jgi:hypothetical protein
VRAYVIWSTCSARARVCVCVCLERTSKKKVCRYVVGGFGYAGSGLVAQSQELGENAGGRYDVTGSVDAVEFMDDGSSSGTDDVRESDDGGALGIGIWASDGTDVLPGSTSSSSSPSY